ncbi:hypothetical protein KY289_037337 [Solanum tuberosum]|nr:hypothetical protein KY289_037337 [Solanum tuberosum]
MKVVEVLRINGGIGDTSYANNSLVQDPSKFAVAIASVVESTSTSQGIVETKDTKKEEVESEEDDAMDPSKFAVAIVVVVDSAATSQGIVDTVDTKKEEEVESEEDDAI